MLDGLPLAGAGRSKNGVDDGHVGDAFFEGDGDGGAFEDGAREGVALERVLVDDGEGFGGDAGAEDVAAVVGEQACGAIGRGVERDLDFDAALCAVELHALVRDELRAAGEDGVTCGEVEERGGEAISVELRVAVDEAGDAGGFLVEAGARSLDAVAADVVESAAAGFWSIADVGGVSVEVAEESGDGAELADAAFVDEGAEAQPLRVGADHEGFADEDAVSVADSEEGLGFGEVHADGLFAEDVLAGFGGFDGPRNVKLVGERVVDGVDGRVGEEFFVGAVGGGDVELRGDGAGLGEVAGGDGSDGGELALLHGGENFFYADVGGGEDSPADFFGHGNRVQKSERSALSVQRSEKANTPKPRSSRFASNFRGSGGSKVGGQPSCGQTAPAVRIPKGPRLAMRGFRALLCVAILPLVLSACAAGSQAQQGSQGQQVSQSSTPTFQVTSRLVFLDVTVLDKKGQPVVTGLTKDDFKITEDKKPQRIFPSRHRRRTR